MLESLALIFLVGLGFGWIFEKLRLPSLIGMILAGILLGRGALNLLGTQIMSVSAELRQMALVIILMRAGLSLDLSELKQVGRPAILLCFVPACFEIFGCVLLAPLLFGMTRLEAAILGSVLAAVSPAVVVPRMLRVMEEGYGAKHSIGPMILAGASVDDVFVIVLFTAFTSLAAGQTIGAADFLQIPVSILLGIAFGTLCGFLLTLFYRKFQMRDTVKLLILLSVSFLFLALQNRLQGIVPFSGLLAVMALGIVLKRRFGALAERFSVRCNKLWVAAEILLFVLVGATVDLSYALAAGVFAILLVLGALCFRMLGVFFCVTGTKLNRKECLFCMLSYTPKATVQAAIGAIPLGMGLACGNTVLAVAVLAILITAPFGAICIDKTYRKLLKKEENLQ